MGVMKELYFDSWKLESYPYAGITRIRFKGYNLSLAAPHSFQGAKVKRFLKDERGFCKRCGDKQYRLSRFKSA